MNKKTLEVNITYNNGDTACLDIEQALAYKKNGEEDSYEISIYNTELEISLRRYDVVLDFLNICEYWRDYDFFVMLAVNEVINPIVERNLIEVAKDIERDRYILYQDISNEEDAGRELFYENYPNVECDCLDDYFDFEEYYEDNIRFSDSGISEWGFLYDTKRN